MTNRHYLTFFFFKISTKITDLFHNQNRTHEHTKRKIEKKNEKKNIMKSTTGKKVDRDTVNKIIGDKKRQKKKKTGQQTVNKWDSNKKPHPDLDPLLD